MINQPPTRPMTTTVEARRYRARARTAGDGILFTHAAKAATRSYNTLAAGCEISGHIETTPLAIEASTPQIGNGR
jgi:hypothetical protein